MMANVVPAASIPSPCVGPWNNGKKPNQCDNHGSTDVRSQGDNTEIPHKP